MAKRKTAEFSTLSMMRPPFGRIVECVEIFSSSPDGYAKLIAQTLPPDWIATTKINPQPVRLRAFLYL